MHHTWRTCCVSLALMLAWALPAHAASHALLMWIGDYAEPSAKLRGIEHDAKLAADMSAWMGVTKANTTMLTNRQATHEGMREAWAGLIKRVKSGDTVFIYFSGHGGQLGPGGSQGCNEGLATWDNRVYFDAQLRQHLDALARVASQVVMFNDSCFSGGAVSKSFGARGLDGSADEAQIKAYPGQLSMPSGQDIDGTSPMADRLAAEQGRSKGGTVADGSVATGSVCGVAANVSKALGSFARALQAKGADVFYLAAAAANQAAFGCAKGSLATRAWAACMAPSKQRSITGQALAECAQRWVDKQPGRYKQTITPLLDTGITLRLGGGP
jgi:hypothetical protein